MSALYCVEHARRERLVAAAGVVDGRSACAEHGGATAGAASLRLDACTGCRATPHPAWFVVGGRPLCIRHAAEAVFGDDDMGAHDMAHAAYLALHAAGVTDTY